MKLKIFFSYLFSFVLLFTAIIFSCLYLWSVYFSTKSEYRIEKIYLTRGDTTQNFYVAHIPQKVATGLLVLNYISLTQQGLRIATENGLVVLSGTPSSDSLGSLVEESVLVTIDNMIADALTRYQIPENKIVIGGLSAGGTAAIRYAQFCKAGRSSNNISLAGVVAADPPVDYSRLWSECKNAIERNVYGVSSLPDKSVMDYMSNKLGSKLEENPQRYQNLSPFDYKEKNGGRAALLVDMPLRLYIEPDVNWYIDNKGKDYYDMNAVDCAGMINRLKMLGNKRAELILTKDKGYNSDGTKNPHSWSIVDEPELISWVVDLFEKNKN